MREFRIYGRQYILFIPVISKRAKQLLTGAGYTNGFETMILFEAGWAEETNNHQEYRTVRISAIPAVENLGPHDLTEVLCFEDDCL